MLAGWLRDRGSAEQVRHLRRRIAELEAQAQEQRRELERLDRVVRLFEGAALVAVDGIALFATDGGTLLWNRGLERLTGWQSHEIPTDSVMLDRIALDDADRAAKQEWWSELLATVGVVKRQVEIRRKDGEPRRFSLRFERYPRGLMVHLHDDDAIADAQAALETSERRYRSLVRRLGVGLYSIDNPALGRFSSVNPEFARMLGYDSVEAALAGNPLDHHVTTATGGAPVEALVERVGADGLKVFSYETRLRRADGQAPIWALVTVTAAVDANATYARQDGMVQDISARRSVQRALADSEGRFRALFEQNAVGMTVCEGNGLLLRVNPAFCKFVGYDAEELFDLGVDALTHPDDRAREAALIKGLQEGTRNRVELEKRYLHKDGTIVWGQATLCFVRQSGSIAPTIVCMVQDIKERKELAAERERATRLKSLGVLAGGIAHNFNNILTAIVGNLAMARRSPPDALDGRLKRAEDAVWRAQGLTQQLLTFAKGGDPVVASAHLSHIARTSAELCLAGTSVRWTLTVDAALEWPVAVDARQIDQVFNNLLINAEQAMTDGGTVEMAIANVHIAQGAPAPLPPGRYVQLTVRDSGPGIEAAHQGRIFDPYFTTKPNGTGLGLATCFSIVKRHDGHIKLSAESGVGSVFVILLPASEAAPPAVKPAALPKPGRGRILVMDDEDAIRETASEMLEETGYEVVAVPDGESAVAAWHEAKEQERPFDLAIVDLTVPGAMGGAAAVVAIHAVDPSARAIVSSGYSDSPVLADWRAHGFVGSVGKPYGVRQLLDAVGAALSEPNADE